MLARLSWGCLRPWMNYPNTYAVPRMADLSMAGRSRSWAEVPILGCVIERLWLIIRIRRMIIQVLPWRMYRMLWWKCTTSAEDRNYSNSRVHGQGRLDGHTVPLSDVFKIKCEGWIMALTWPQRELWRYEWSHELWLWLDHNGSCGIDINVPT